MVATGEITPDNFPTGRWRGKWVSAPYLETGLGHHTIIFRKNLYINEIIGPIPTRVTADSRYILFVNGVEVFRGPIRSQPRRLSYDLFDLSPHVRTGENVIAVQVKYYGENTAWWIKAETNTTLGSVGVFAFEARIGNEYIVSDESWKAYVADAWSSVSMKDRQLSAAPLEVFDARKLPTRWSEFGFDDISWPHAQAVSSIHMGSKKYDTPPTDPYGPMLPRPITKLTADTRRGVVHLAAIAHGVDVLFADPVQQVLENFSAGHLELVDGTTLPCVLSGFSAGNPVIILDFGEEVAGTIRFDLEAQSGTVIDVAVMEALDDFATANQHAGFRYIARGYEDRFESFDPMGLRYARICISNLEGDFKLNDFTVCERLYPFAERGYFRSSDNRLDHIYEAGVRTVALTSHDAFIDCPSREQRAWVGDSVVHQMVHLTVNSDWKLATWNPQLANSPRYDGILPMSVAGDTEAERGANIPEWSLHWIRSVNNLYMYVGDRDLIAALLPTVERILRWFVPYRNDQGLLTELPEWVLVDWSTLMLEGTSSLMNAHFALGLWQFAEMADWVEDTGRAKWARAIWTQIRDSFDVFWDPVRQVYVDNIVDGVQGRAMSQLAQALPICAHLVPHERLDTLLHRMTDQDRLVRASWLTEVFEEFIQNASQGLGAKDSNHLLLDAIVNGSMSVRANWDVEQYSAAAQPFMRYIVHDAIALAGGTDKIPEMCLDWNCFLESGAQTFWELWSGGSRCHGWSSTPTRDLIQYSLGVTPLEPGFRSARIAPCLGRLSWAEGKVPTPFGYITVFANRETITVDSPIPIEVHSQDGKIYQFAPGPHVVDVSS